MKKIDMKRKMIKDLKKMEKNGKIKALNKYGKDGLSMISYLYTDIYTRNTETLRQELRIVTSWSREEFERIVDLTNKELKNYN